MIMWREPDELPDEKRRVLVYVENPDEERNIKISQRIKGEWKCKDTVLAWMSLPPAPEWYEKWKISEVDFIGFWNPVSEILPPVSGTFLITVKLPIGFYCVFNAFFSTETQSWVNWPEEELKIVAWMQMPVPYREK